MVKTEQKIQSETSTKQLQSTSTSLSKNKKYKGVRMRSWGSWVSEIRAPNQKTRIWLGSYSTAEAAARAYDAALLCLKGSSANLNIPISASSHYGIPDDHTVMTPKSIQRVAAAAATAANTFVDNVSTASEILSPSLPSSSSSTITSTTTSSSSISSPSTSSSPSDQLDDDVSLLQSFGIYTGQPISVMEPWLNFDGIQSPKYVDHQMFINGVSSFDFPPLMDDFFDEEDIRLWNFC